MGETNISNVGSILAAKSASKTGADTLKNQGALDFSVMMNQAGMKNASHLMHQNKNNAFGAVSGKTAAAATAETKGSAEDFKRYQYQDRTIQTKTADVKTENREVIREKVDEFAEDVKQVLKSELDVTDEEIQEAMEALGFQYPDLLNQGNLALLAAELTGSDSVNQMLCSEAFVNVLQEVNALGRDLLQNLQLSGQELLQAAAAPEAENAEVLTAGEVAPEAKDAEALADSEAMPEAFNNAVRMTEEAETSEKAEMPEKAETLKESPNAPEKTADEAKDMPEAQTVIDAEGEVRAAEGSEGGKDAAAAEQETFQAISGDELPEVKAAEEAVKSGNAPAASADAEKASDTAKPKEEGRILTKNEPADELDVQEAKDAPAAADKEEPEGSSGEELSGHGQDKSEEKPWSIKAKTEVHVDRSSHAGISAAPQENVLDRLSSMETVQKLPEYVSIRDIMEQIVGSAKTTLSAEMTKLEMQLNPEHLGKIYLEVAQKEGAVTARIQAQNEAVKEALESQMAELKENMNQAGIKVDSVEVTVASHEFERNLEQDARRQEQQAEEHAKASKQRKINLNSLDDLAGLMSEEEMLAAKIMAEQGNSVDFTA